MTPAEIDVKIRLAESEAKFWKDILASKSCNDCVNYQRGGCTLAPNNMQPPPEVVKTGCDSWSWDEIPF